MVSSPLSLFIPLIFKDQFTFHSTHIIHNGTSLVTETIATETIGYVATFRIVGGRRLRLGHPPLLNPQISTY